MQRRASFFCKNGRPNRAIIRRAANPATTKFAQQLRKRMTPSEQAIWDRLRPLRLRFRRQAVVLGWIADFYHSKSRLVIEIDGGYHETPKQKAKDAYRDGVMRRHGFRVLRIPNDRVARDFERVIEQIIGETQCGRKDASGPAALPAKDNAASRSDERRKASGLMQGTNGFTAARTEQRC